jgi:hypothetical protein
MPVQNEANRLNDVVLWEGDFGVRYSRRIGDGRNGDSITILSGRSLALGAVLGKVTANGKYKEWDPVAVDGSQTVAGILTAAVDATAADAKGVAMLRMAVVKANGLVWKAGLTGAQITTGVGGLASIGIMTVADV